MITDPHDSPYCWSHAEVGTPDAILHTLTCERMRHRWGRHRNRHVKWACPRGCGCVRHPQRDGEATTE